MLVKTLNTVTVQKLKHITFIIFNVNIILQKFNFNAVIYGIKSAQSFNTYENFMQVFITKTF